jgi:hypothetical protein
VLVADDYSFGREWEEAGLRCSLLLRLGGRVSRQRAESKTEAYLNLEEVLWGPVELLVTLLPGLGKCCKVCVMSFLGF